MSVELTGKRFDLISELIPQAKVIALLMNPNNEGTERQTRDAQVAAHDRGRGSISSGRAVKKK